MWCFCGFLLPGSLTVHPLEILSKDPTGKACFPTIFFQGLCLLKRGLTLWLCFFAGLFWISSGHQFWDLMILRVVYHQPCSSPFGQVYLLLFQASWLRKSKFFQGNPGWWIISGIQSPTRIKAFQSNDRGESPGGGFMFFFVYVHPLPGEMSQ